MRSDILTNTALLWLVAAVVLPHRSTMAITRLIPLEERVEQVDLIVIGTLRETVAGSQTLAVDGDCQYRIDTGLLKIERILMGNVPPTGVWIAFHTHVGGSMIVCPAPQHYRTGDAGIWLLTKDPRNPYYWAAHADDRRSIDDLSQVKTSLEFSDAKAKSGILPRVEATYPRLPNKQCTLKVGITNISDDILEIRKGDILSASVVKEGGPGNLQVHAVTFQIGEMVSISPQATQSLAVMELTIDKPGSYSLRVSLKTSESANSRLKAWGDALFSPSEWIYVLDPERHSQATGVARTLLDLHDTDGAAFDAKFNALCSQDDMTFVSQLAITMNIDELRVLVTPMLEKAVTELGEKTASALVSALNGIDDRMAMGDLNFLLMKATNTSIVEIEFAEANDLLTYELLPDGGRSQGTRPLSRWRNGGTQRILPADQELDFLRRRFTGFWHLKIHPRPAMTPTTMVAYIAFPLTLLAVLVGAAGIWLHRKSKSSANEARQRGAS